MTITKSVQTSTRSYHYYCLFMRLLWWLSCKESTCNAGNLGSIPGSGRSHGGGPGNSLQQFCLENPIDWGAWWAAVHQGSQRAGHDWVTGHTHVPLCDSQVVASCVQQERPGRMGVGGGPPAGTERPHWFKIQLFPVGAGTRWSWAKHTYYNCSKTIIMSQEQQPSLLCDSAPGRPWDWQAPSSPEKPIWEVTKLHLGRAYGSNYSPCCETRPLSTDEVADSLSEARKQ